MARPKRKQGEASVPDRLQTTFFEMIEEAPYADITVAALSRKTGINHNTFYYYYDNIDALVTQAIEQSLSSDMPAYLLKNFTGDEPDFKEITDSKEFEVRLKRISLLVSENSTTWIINLLKESVLNLWLSSLGITKEQLTAEQSVIFYFWLGGVFSVWDKYGKDHSPLQFMSVLQSDVTKALMASINQIKADHSV